MLSNKSRFDVFMFLSRSGSGTTRFAHQPPLKLRLRLVSSLALAAILPSDLHSHAGQASATAG
jgi:hypothetical protein